MISTPMCCTSDYYSGSDDDDDIVKAAPQYHCSTKETNIILQTLLQYDNDHQQMSCLSSTKICVEQSMRLLKLVRENNLSDEVFIRSNAILHKFLLSTCTNETDQFILVACLSLATKLCEYSNHLSISLFNSDTLTMNENMICNAVDWEIDLITPINYVEAILPRLTDCSMKDRLRELSYRLIVLCMTDIRCFDSSAVSIGMGCLLTACEAVECCAIVPQEILFKYDEDNGFLKAASISIRQVAMNVLC